MTEKYSISELRKISRENRRKNGFISYLFFFLALLLVGGFLAMGLFGTIFFILFVPMVILPLFFAAQAATIISRNNEVITFSLFFKSIFTYFLEHFKATFRTWRSAAYSLIFYGAVLLTSQVFAISFFYIYNYYGFADMINSASKVISMSESEMTAFINSYTNTFQMFMITTSYPALTVFFFVYVYLCGTQSVTLFYRLKYLQMPGKYITLVYAETLKKNKKDFVKKYWALNWPLYLLLILGFALGSYLGTLYQFSAPSLFTLGAIVALFVAFVGFGPTYLANKEALAKSLEDDFVVEEAFQRKKLTQSFQDILKTMEEETKKDSDES